MARRKTVKPNIPNDTLARARAQVGLPSDTPETEAEGDVSTAETTIDSSASPVASVENQVRVVARKPTNKRMQEVEFERKKKKGELSQDVVKEMLLNPTRFPNADDMRHDYTHVVRDLRNMFLLSLVLIVFLVVLATALPGA